jgi:energy-coupling factor transporter ATP-binding protein EcfA2
MKIKKLHVEGFTVFQNNDIEFCDGINVLIGANGTGKSHLLKILYSLTRAVPARPRKTPNWDDAVRLLVILNGVFRPEDGMMERLLRSKRKSSAQLHMQSSNGHHYAELPYGNYFPDAVSPDSGIPVSIETAGLFIPPNEVLAIYPGFTKSYELRELSFDQTYYDICSALSAAPLRKETVVFSRLLLRFSDLLGGRVVEKGGRFYLSGAEGKREMEAHLLAEGHRKLATVAYLLRNGSINKNTVLFWDEPEANLNPKLIKQVADFLRELARVGIQIFVATHDYLLTGELSMAAEYQMPPRVPIRFFAMSRRNDEPVQIQPGDTLADLGENPILDEFAAHYQREQEAAIRVMKKRIPG